MSRTRTPEAAAKAIIDMIARGDATDAADAVAQDETLRPGLEFAQAAFCRPAATAGSEHPAVATAATGSGSALLSR